MGMMLIGDEAHERLTRVKAYMKKTGKTGYSYSGAIDLLFDNVPKELLKELEKVTQKEIDEVKAAKGQEHNTGKQEGK